MPAGEPEVFDVVRIGDSEEARDLELVDAEGVVLGVTEDETTHARWFAVQVGDRPTVMLAASDLTRTGRTVPRESIYSHGRLRVSLQGRVRGYEPGVSGPDSDGEST
jgi:hypothetical protein